jgi:hypothetical protein
MSRHGDEMSRLSCENLWRSHLQWASSILPGRVKITAMNNHSFRDPFSGLPGENLRDWAFNPLHPTCIKLVTATMLATSLAYLLLGTVAR